MKMKTNYLNGSICLIAMLFMALASGAQTKPSVKTAYNISSYNTYDRTLNEQGKQIERIQIDWNGRTYKLELVNDKLTGLFVDGEKIPAGDWDKYNDVISAVREQIKQNRIQASKNQEQARLNQIQAVKNQEQAGRNQEQARLNQLQQEKNQQQAVKNQEQAVRNQEQARLNQIQEEKNQGQAVRNQEQARLNQLQAKKNQEQAEENQRMMKLLIADLINDKIISSENGLHDLTINNYEMIVNGTKQPEEVFKKYKEKYDRLSQGSFTIRN